MLGLLPEPEAMGLLALMLLQESRRAARVSPTGDLILLEDQDRSLWNREQIAEGKALMERALSSRRDKLSKGRKVRLRSPRIR